MEWADPGGTAIPGQPVEKLEQAPKSSPKSKNQFNVSSNYTDCMSYWRHLENKYNYVSLS